MIFGKEKDKGIYLNGLKPQVVNLSNGFDKNKIIKHDQFTNESTLANLLSNFEYPDFPVPMGVIRQIEKSTYEEKIDYQIKVQTKTKGIGNLNDLIRGNQVWKN